MQRQQQIEQLDQSELDILVIGGGASGAGVLLDAATRGYKVGLIDKQDFMAGTSSRSTKLIHGGVRYLEQAVKTLDFSLLQLVQDGLRERQAMLAMAPHLTRAIPLVTPLKHWYQWPYLRTGLGLYDLLARRRSVGKTRTLGQQALQARCRAIRPDFPLAVEYWDGQFDDARFGIAMIRTAVDAGGIALNHCQIEHIGRTEHGYQISAREHYSQRPLTIRCKTIVNCTGPWTDHIRQLVRPNMAPIVKTSGGAHIVVSTNAVPLEQAVLIPKTSDGRVLFMIPWYQQVIIGTTDTANSLSDQPHATEDDIHYLLNEANNWLAHPIGLADVQATFKGLRPLVDDQSATTASISRDHQVIVEDKMITLTGGKWTTWRQMAEDATDKACEIADLPQQRCRTSALQLVGYQATPVDISDLVAPDIALHLWQCYGSEAQAVLQSGSQQRIDPNHPWIEAELAWAVAQEAAVSPEDIAHRRLRLNTVDDRLLEKAMGLLTRA